MVAAMLGNVLLGLGLLALVMVGAVAGIREEFVRLPRAWREEREERLGAFSISRT